MPCLGFSRIVKRPLKLFSLIIFLFLFPFSCIVFNPSISSQSIHVITHQHMLSRLISPKILSIPHHANLGSFGLLTEEKTLAGPEPSEKPAPNPCIQKGSVPGFFAYTGSQLSRLCMRLFVAFQPRATLDSPRYFVFIQTHAGSSLNIVLHA